MLLHPRHFTPQQIKHPVGGRLAHFGRKPRLLLFEQMEFGDAGPFFGSGLHVIVEVPVVGVLDARFHILAFPTTGHDFIIDPLRPHWRFT